MRKPHAIIHFDFCRRLVLCLGQLVDHAQLAAVGTVMARRQAHGLGRYRARNLRHVFGLVALLALPAAFADTPAEINAKFPSLISQNQARFSRLTDHEVFKLAQAYTFANHGDPYALAAVISDPVQRARYLKAAQIMAPRPVLPRFGGHVARQMAAAPLVPNVGMTLDEIYLVYRTGQSMTVTAALYETSYFVGLNVGVAWGVGWYTGSAVSYLLQNYAPGVDNGIGATMTFLFDGANTIIPAQWNDFMLSADDARWSVDPDHGPGDSSCAVMYDPHICP